MSEAQFPRIPLLKLSEKSRTPLQRSLTGHRNGTFRAVLAFVYWPNLRSKPRSDPFSDSFSRDCPKSLGRACNVALRVIERVPLAHFGLRIPAKSTVGALLEPLFGQSHKVNSRKLSFQYSRFSETWNL